MSIPAIYTNKTTDGDEIDTNNKSLYWKIKAIASKTMYRMFTKYGDPNYFFNKKDLADI